MHPPRFNPRFNSKLFWRIIMVFAIIDACILFTACGGWIGTAQSIISLLGPAITAVLQILTALGVAVSPTFMTAYDNWSKQAINGLEEIKTLLAQYQSAVVTAQAGIIGQIQTILDTISTNLSTVLNDLHITDANSQQRVSAAFAAIMAMFSAVLALLPALKSSLSGEEVDEHEFAAKYTVFKMTAKNFKKTFNAAVSYFGEQYELK